jgi:hypothetical protein
VYRDCDSHEDGEEGDCEAEELGAVFETKVGERDSYRDTLGEAVDGEDSEYENELLEVRLLVVARVEVGVGDDIVRDDDEGDADERTRGYLDGSPLVEPLLDLAVQRRGDHYPRREPPEEDVAAVAYLVEQKKRESADARRERGD